LSFRFCVKGLVTSRCKGSWGLVVSERRHPQPNQQVLQGHQLRPAAIPVVPPCLFCFSHWSFNLILLQPLVVRPYSASVIGRSTLFCFSHWSFNLILLQPLVVQPYSASAIGRSTLLHDLGVVVTPDRKKPASIDRNLQQS
jgi:hypothetical protein